MNKPYSKPPATWRRVFEFLRKQGSKSIVALSLATYLPFPEQPSEKYKRWSIRLLAVLAASSPAIEGLFHVSPLGEFDIALEEFFTRGYFLACVATTLPLVLWVAPGRFWCRSLVAAAFAAAMLATPAVVSEHLFFYLDDPLFDVDLQPLLTAPVALLPYVVFRLGLQSFAPPGRIRRFFGRLMYVLVVSVALSYLAYTMLTSQQVSTPVGMKLHDLQSLVTSYYVLLAILLVLAAFCSWRALQSAIASLFCMLFAGAVIGILAAPAALDSELTWALVYSAAYAIAFSPGLFETRRCAKGTTRLVNIDVNPYLSSARTLSVAVVLAVLFGGSTVRSFYEQTDGLLELRSAFAEQMVVEILDQLYEDSQGGEAVLKTALEEGAIRSLVDSQASEVGILSSDWLKSQSSRLRDTDGLKVDFFFRRDELPFALSSKWRYGFSVSFATPFRQSAVTWVYSRTYAYEGSIPLFRFVVPAAQVGGSSQSTDLRQEIGNSQLSGLPEGLRTIVWPIDSDSIVVTGSRIRGAEHSLDYQRIDEAVLYLIYELAVRLSNQQHQRSIGSVANKYGYRADSSETDIETFHNTTRMLVDQSVTVPSIGLNLMPLEAVTALAAIVLVMLVVIHSRMCVLDAANTVPSAPWLLLDSTTPLDRFSGLIWRFAIVTSPLCVALFLILSYSRQVIMDGATVSLFRMSVFSAVCLLYFAVGTVIALRTNLAISRLKEKRDEARQT